MSKKGLICDPDAVSAVDKLDYPFERLKINKKTTVLLTLRAIAIDELTSAFLKENPHSIVIYLGCGLDSRAMRLGFPSDHWYDLDFPEVIAVKKQIFPQNDHYSLLGYSVTDLEWLNKININDLPVLVIAEGLLMYLPEKEVKALIVAMKEKFKDVDFVFDAYSKTTAEYAKYQPSLKRTGAAILYGIDHPAEIEGYARGIAHLKTVYLTDRGLINRLGAADRFLFGLAGKFKKAREAHRIFVFRLLEPLR